MRTHSHLLVGTAESEANMLQAEAVFREVLNMSMTIKAPAKSCLRLPDMALVSGPVRAS